MDETKKRRKLVFSRGGRTKNGENIISAAAENQKQANSAFQPWRTNEKRQKYHFSRGRKSKTGKFCVSAAADERKTTKTDFRPRPKIYHPLILMHGSVDCRNRS